ncbi:hypothetical protein DUZ99_06590 [Xylanibacillus composti]|uniref:Uncharacterized protein n=1 Tax=Xylanibacillus composti TaxID=1572762 RepID=A0A8J4H8D9_9BACL|nr:hypothetical protein [Xylanibacillus composti]MDT9724659.1 hypothetical protein [Xylanibacillus composti]GIQ70944.1 hypothetical protein XYCOK13_37680 [Xylanibacillus composti]
MESMFPTQAVPADYIKHPGSLVNAAPNLAHSAAASNLPALTAPAMHAKAAAPAFTYPKSIGCTPAYPALAAKRPAPVSVILVLFVLLVIICRVWPVAPLAKTCKK